MQQIYIIPSPDAAYEQCYEYLPECSSPFPYEEVDNTNGVNGVSDENGNQNGNENEEEDEDRIDGSTDGSIDSNIDASVNEIDNCKQALGSIQ